LFTSWEKEDVQRILLLNKENESRKVGKATEKSSMPKFRIEE
jgi:hypothetical protein